MPVTERIAPECGCSTTGKIVRGMCTTHYDRWVHKTPKAERDVAPRFARQFWDFVDKSGDCWLWTGGVNRKGYGWWSGEGADGRRGLAHRIALAEVDPPGDPALFACHRCDNPPCVNPAHLYWGTAADNARDVVERQGVWNKGQRSSVCPRGHAIVGDNLRVVGGLHKCRECDNARSREYQRRKRAERVGGVA